MHWLHAIHWGTLAAGVGIGLFLFWLVLFFQSEEDPNWKSPPDN